jgi:hypothetical protein
MDLPSSGKDGGERPASSNTVGKRSMVVVMLEF